MVRKMNYSTNQINKIQRRLSTVVNKAISEGVKVNPYFKNGTWKVKVSKLNDNGIAFTEKEIKIVKDIVLKPNLDRIRDRFLIGVNTGQRYSDFKEFNIENTITINGELYFDFIQKKTNIHIRLKVSKAVKEIFKKYDGYPPIISEVKFNKYIKQVFRIAKIKDEVIVRKDNPIDGITSEIKLMKYQVVSSHDCRRTFCSIAHSKGIPLAEIMKVSGHSSLKTLSLYLKISLSATSICEEDII